MWEKMKEKKKRCLPTGHVYSNLTAQATVPPLCLWTLQKYPSASGHKQFLLRGRKEESRRRSLSWALLVMWKLLVLHWDKTVILTSEMYLEAV